MALMESAEHQIESAFRQIEKTIDLNQWKVISAFQKHKVSDYHFASSTGYGYNDRGREVLDLVYADVMGAEAALVRPHFVSGTHTIGTALFGVLRPGEHLLYITGKPYDTLHKVIGKPGDGMGSLQDFGIAYSEVALTEDGAPDWSAIAAAIQPNTKVIGIQRSRGYSWRPSFTVEQIGEMVRFVKEVNPALIVFVDNCYGEFTELQEPTEVGVDLMAGSLIKNPGGGIAPSGGYIAGRRDLVELAAYQTDRPRYWGRGRCDARRNASDVSRAFPCPSFGGASRQGLGLRCRGVRRAGLREPSALADAANGSDPSDPLHVGGSLDHVRAGHPEGGCRGFARCAGAVGYARL